MYSDKFLESVKADFKNFLYVVWKHKNLPNPTEIQYDIADYLQNGARRRMIEAFRGVGKSWITSAYVVWLLLNNPQRRILVVSATKERADNFTTFTKSLLDEIEFLKFLKPGKNQRDSKVSFDVAPALSDHAPSVKSASITGQLAGSRADYIIPDDIEIPNNSDTQAAREKLGERIKEFDAILKPGGEIIYLGTPQCEDSIYNQLPARGYEIRVWTARYPTAKKLPSLEGKLAPLLSEKIKDDPTLSEGGFGDSGQPTEPSRFPEPDLIERQLSYGAAGFALQFQLDTSLSDLERYPLKLSNFIVTDLDKEKAPIHLSWTNNNYYKDETLPNVGLTGDSFFNPQHVEKEWEKYTGSILAIDPSGRGNDRTGFAVVKMLHGRLFITRAGGVKGGYDDETLRQLAIIAKNEKVNSVIIESNFGDGMFSKIFQPILHEYYRCGIEEVRHSVQKEMRIIDTLEPVLSQHRLVLDRQVIIDDYEKEKDNSHRLFYQLTRITRARGALKHDDALDALAIAVNWWTESMAIDSKKSEETWKDKQVKQVVKDFLTEAKGSAIVMGKPKKKSRTFGCRPKLK